jgi:Ferritin-like
MSSEVATRSRLLTLLSEACEVEHGLACSYLYAAFSLKHGQSEGLGFEQEQKVRWWAAQISFVATQEMLHLAQAWNLLQAVGGTPYHLHPTFPLVRGGLPIDVTLSLEGFSKATLQRFLAWERPFDARPKATADAPYTTVGELYDRIDRLVVDVDARTKNLFISSPSLQIGPEVADFPDLVRVVDVASAREAIRRIRHQGEGNATDRDDCHFGMFRALDRELDVELARDAAFAPAVSVVANPTARPSPGATQVHDATARRVMALFDDVYGLTIRTLAWTFASAKATDPLARAFARFAIRSMVAVLRPLGELLMRLPSGIPGLGAGPSFGIARHVPLPDDGMVARQVAFERACEIATELDRCSQELFSAQDRRVLMTIARSLAEESKSIG